MVLRSTGYSAVMRVSRQWRRRRRNQHRNGDRWQARDLDDRLPERRRGPGWRPGTAAAPPGRWRWRRYPVAGQDGHDDARDGLSGGRRAQDAAVRRRAIDVADVVGDLEPESFNRCRASSWVRPATEGTRESSGPVDIAGIGGRQFHLAEVVGDRVHRGEPGGRRLTAAGRVAVVALAQREGAQLARVGGVVVDVEAPARVLVKPMKPADRCASVVPVLPAIGGFQPTGLADPAAVPLPWSS